MSLDDNREVAATSLRYTYDSLTTPKITYQVDSRTGARTVLKRTPAPNYNPANYVTERVWATARDGTRIPVSLVYRKGFKRDGTAAMLQYGYGSYGLSTDPAWSPTIPSLLDRGMVYAIAHIRGGQEMGRAWYDQGHLLNKKNSFTDFIDVTALPDQPGLCGQGPGRGAGRQRRRPADGRGRQHGAAGLSRDRRAGPVCRCGDDHARRVDPADHQRI